MDNRRVAIVGAGQAAAQAAQSLRQLGHAGPVTIYGDETWLPYQRPPLSKGWLSGAMDLDRVTLRPAEAWTADDVAIHLSCQVVSIDPARKRLALANGETPEWDALILATGARARRLSVPGHDLAGIHVLRGVDDAEGLKAGLAAARRLVVIGGGYVGLEVAAVARKAGLEVTLVEAMDRILARVAPPELSEFYTRFHQDHGVDILTGSGVAALNGVDGRVASVTLANGRTIPCDLVLAGIGIVPDAALAEAAGLTLDNGIAVDEDARTSDPNIYAAGDCASRPLVHYGGRRGRLESVHNALEQAKLAAAAIMGAPRPAVDVPWFWSDQYDLKLQIAGLSSGACHTVLRGDMEQNRFALFHLDAEHRVLAVDAVNAAPEYLVGKQLIARQARLAPDILADMSVSMKDMAARAA